MPRVFALIALICCLCSPVAASELVFKPAAKPALGINFDGTRHVDVCHKGKGQEQNSDSVDKSDEVSFEKPTTDGPASTTLLVCAGLAASVAGVAVKWGSIAKTVTAVH